jgi:hypothetical protein
MYGGISKKIKVEVAATATTTMIEIFKIICLNNFIK